MQLMLLPPGSEDFNPPRNIPCIGGTDDELEGVFQPVNISQHLYRNRLEHFKEFHLCIGVFTAGCPLPGFLEQRSDRFTVPGTGKHQAIITADSER